MVKYNPEANLKELGRRIGELRSKKGLTQEKLSVMVGVQRLWIARIESGWSTTTRSLFKIANALNVPIGELFKKPQSQPPGRGRPQKRKVNRR